MRTSTTLILSLIAVLSSTTSTRAQPSNVDPGLDGPTCDNHVEQVPNEVRVHIPEDQDPVYNHNPPVSGEHYPIWARWQIDTEIPRGYWVHNLEHGGVVFLYNPDLASQDIIDALVRVYTALPNDDSTRPDDGCFDPCDHPRAVLVPDSLLDAPWAVTVSGPEISPDDLGVGYVIKSDCIDSEQALIDFAVQHRNHSAECICDEGFVP